MIWDSCLIRATARELATELAGARATGFLFDRDTRRVVVYFRKATFLVDLSGTGGWLSLEEPRDLPNSAHPLPATVASVWGPLDERLLFMAFRRIRGKQPNPTLILELATNRWNAIWAEGPELKVAKRLRVDERRPQKVGQPWKEPSGPPRLGAEGTLTEAEWDRLLADGDGRRTLLRTVAHVSSLNVAEFLLPASTGGGFPAWQRMARLEGVDPRILDAPNGPQPYPWPVRGIDSTPASSVLEALTLVSRAPASGTPSSDWLETHFDRERKRLEGKRRQIERQLARATHAPELRDTGHLILASLHLIPSGSDQVTVPGFDGTPTTLELDPKVKPQAHADDLFRRAARLERASRELPLALSQVGSQLEDLDAQRARHRAGTLPEAEVERIRGLATAAPTKGKQKQAPTEPYRVYRSSGGLEIRVGRGSKRNDELTFHHSRPDDVWLHARHSAGAHVILRWTESDRPPARDLEEAATLAALFSKARGSAHVPVDWTRRKYVRKPRGTRPGLVIVEKAETLFVSPDPDLADRLAEE